MNPITKLLTYIKARRHIGARVKIEIREYKPTPKERHLDDCVALFNRCIDDKATMADRIQASKEMDFLEDINKNLEAYLEGEAENMKDDLKSSLELTMNLGRVALDR